MSSFVLLSVISVILSLMLAWYIWKHMNKENKHTYFILLMLSVTVWSIFAVLEVLSVTMDLKILFSKLSYIGIVCVPVFWVLFSMEYAEKYNWISKKQIIRLGIIPIMTLLIVSTNELHHLYWSKIYFEHTFDSISIYKYERGPWFLVNVFYIYILLAIGLVIFFDRLKETKKLKDYFPVILGAVLPVASNVLYISRILELDYTPAAFAITCICFGWAIITGFLQMKMGVAETIHVNMQEGIILIDEKLRISSMNPYAGSIIGLEQLPVNAKAEKLIFFWDKLKDKLSQNANEEFELDLDDGLDKKWFRIHLYSVNKKNNIDGWLVSLFDITEKKRNEEALRLLDQEARKAAEAANIAKSIFLANMSHEIRTPMNGIIGFVDVLSQTSLNREQYDYLNEIRNASDSLLHMINEVLDFSKIEADKMELECIDFNLHNLIEGAITLIAPGAFNKGVEVHSQISAGVPEMVKGDPNRLRQVFNNLLSNALKFTYNGDITISVECTGTIEDRLGMKFSVKDTGIGMSQNVLNSIFKPFTQADSSTTRKYGGTGLGLTICKKLIEMMGGTISVESVENVGSTFSFELYLKKGNDVEPVKKNLATKHLIAEDTVKDKKAVLLAEDTEANRKLAAIMLKKAGYEYEVVVNGQDAVDACKKKRYDIVLMDCQMPILDGYEATRMIKSSESLNKSTPIIAMTANALEGDREKCLQAGMDDYISKPINLKRLEEMLNKWFVNKL